MWEVNKLAYRRQQRKRSMGAQPQAIDLRDTVAKTGAQVLAVAQIVYLPAIVYV